MILAGILLFYGTLAKIDAANVVMAYLTAHTKAMLVIVVVIGLSAKTAADADSVGGVFEGLVRASTSLSVQKSLGSTSKFQGSLLPSSLSQLSTAAQDEMASIHNTCIVIAVIHAIELLVYFYFGVVAYSFYLQLKEGGEGTASATLVNRF